MAIRMPFRRRATAAAPPQPRPVRERGYSNEATGDYWADLANEPTPELQWPLSIAVYDRMRRQDAQVASMLRAVTTPITRTQWRIDGTGCDPAVTEFVADNLGLPIDGADPEDDHRARLRGRDRFSWDDHIRQALLMLPFGHMPFEQVYRYDEAADQYRLRKLGPRMPRTIAQFNVASDGGLISIQQHGTLGSSNGTTLPISRLVVYVLEREGGNWLGQSLLRSCYKNWLLKDHALRTWAQTIERQGMGVPVYTAAQDEKSLDAGEELAADVRAGEDSGAAIPYGAKLDLVGVTGQLPDIEKFVQYQDSQIARSMLGHFLNLGGQTNGQVGSYNLGSVFQGTFHLGLDSVAGQVKAIGDAHVIEDLVDINFGPSVPAPQLVYDPIGTQLSELDRVREAAGLTSDADLVKFLRSVPNQSEEGAA